MTSLQAVEDLEEEGDMLQDLQARRQKMKEEVLGHSTNQHVFAGPEIMYSNCYSKLPAGKQWTQKLKCSSPIGD